MYIYIYIYVRSTRCCWCCCIVVRRIWVYASRFIEHASYRASFSPFCRTYRCSIRSGSSASGVKIEEFFFWIEERKYGGMYICYIDVFTRWKFRRAEEFFRLGDTDVFISRWNWRFLRDSMRLIYLTFRRSWTSSNRKLKLNYNFCFLFSVGKSKANFIRISEFVLLEKLFHFHLRHTSYRIFTYPDIFLVHLDKAWNSVLCVDNRKPRLAY